MNAKQTTAEGEASSNRLLAAEIARSIKAAVDKANETLRPQGAYAAYPPYFVICRDGKSETFYLSDFPAANAKVSGDGK